MHQKWKPFCLILFIAIMKKNIGNGLLQVLLNFTHSMVNIHLKLLRNSVDLTQLKCELHVKKIVAHCILFENINNCNLFCYFVSSLIRGTNLILVNWLWTHNSAVLWVLLAVVHFPVYCLRHLHSKCADTSRYKMCNLKDIEGKNVFKQGILKWSAVFCESNQIPSVQTTMILYRFFSNMKHLWSVKFNIGVIILRQKIKFWSQLAVGGYPQHWPQSLTLSM